MKSIVCEKYGPPEVLQFKEIEKPEPASNEVRVRVHVTTVTAGDTRVRSLNMPFGFRFIGRLALGFSAPRQPILGTEFAGTVESVGRGVTKFSLGEEVFAFSGAKMGSYAEYICVAEDGVMARRPTNLTGSEAAALSFGGTTALDFLRRANLQKGEKVLVNGASGGVGTAVLQLAKYFGAHVTGVCSAGNVTWVGALGADKVVDYTAEDFTRNGETYDVIVDTVGNALFPRIKNSLNERGRLLQVVAGLQDMLRNPWVSMTTTRKVIAGPTAERAEDLLQLAAIAEAGHFKPVIDREYPFEQIVDAHRYVDTGRKKGNVVITLKGDG